MHKQPIVLELADLNKTKEQWKIRKASLVNR
jgi:hypothetical protein